MQTLLFSPTQSYLPPVKKIYTAPNPGWERSEGLGEVRENIFPRLIVCPSTGNGSHQTFNSSLTGANLRKLDPLRLEEIASSINFPCFPLLLLPLCSMSSTLYNVPLPLITKVCRYSGCHCCTQNCSSLTNLQQP